MKSLLILMSAISTLTLSSPLFAYDIRQDGTNTTSSNAGGIKLVLYGAQAVSCLQGIPFDKFTVTSTGTATGIDYTMQNGSEPVAPSGSGTIFVRTAGSSALAKSLSWISGTGAFLGNVSVTGGYAQASSGSCPIL